MLAQAALFLVLRELPTQSSSSPWISLGPRRFGGDSYKRIITLQYDEGSNNNSDHTATVEITFTEQNMYDVVVTTPTTRKEFHSVSADLGSQTLIRSTISNQQLRTTIVSQPPPVSSNTPVGTIKAGSERLHIFHNGVRTALRVPPPPWLSALGQDAESASASGGKGGGGSVRAPMPSLVVDVRVNVGDKVEEGQALVVLESMKTESVLRAGISGVVGVVGCKKGEMVEEGRELVGIVVDTKDVDGVEKGKERSEVGGTL